MGKSVPQGRPKSGKPWKVGSTRTNTVDQELKSQIKKDFSFEKRMSDKQKMLEARELEKQLRDQRVNKKRQKRKQLEEKRKRKELNDFKSSTYQVINDLSKTKKWNKKLRQKITKMPPTEFYKLIHGKTLSDSYHQLFQFLCNMAFQEFLILHKPIISVEYAITPRFRDSLFTDYSAFEGQNDTFAYSASEFTFDSSNIRQKRMELANFSASMNDKVKLKFGQNSAAVSSLDLERPAQSYSMVENFNPVYSPHSSFEPEIKEEEEESDVIDLLNQAPAQKESKLQGLKLENAIKDAQKYKAKDIQQTQSQTVSTDEVKHNIDIRINSFKHLNDQENNAVNTGNRSEGAQSPKNELILEIDRSGDRKCTCNSCLII